MLDSYYADQTGVIRIYEVETTWEVDLVKVAKMAQRLLKAANTETIKQENVA